MGAYVYGVKKSKPITFFIDGQPQLAARVEYLHKPHHGWGDSKWERTEQLQIANVHRGWDGVAHADRPDYLVHSKDGKVAEGTMVRQWKDKDRITFYDEAFPEHQPYGLLVGWLKREGKRWVLSRQRPMRWDERDAGHYFPRSAGQCGFCGSHPAFVTAQCEFCGWEFPAEEVNSKRVRDVAVGEIVMQSGTIYQRVAEVYESAYYARFKVLAPFPGNPEVRAGQMVDLKHTFPCWIGARIDMELAEIAQRYPRA